MILSANYADFFLSICDICRLFRIMSIIILHNTPASSNKQQSYTNDNNRPFHPNILLAFENVMQSRPVKRGERKNE
jgi:hypothetical protein